jgi:membrane-bound lytic murein transglycosylase A
VPPPPVTAPAEPPAKPAEVPSKPAEPPVVAPPATKEPAAEGRPSLVAAAWSELPNWADDDPVPALNAFLAGCRVLANRDGWQGACAEAAALRNRDRASVRRFFETRFRPYRALNADGSNEGLITGYYEPLLRGSRKQTPRYRYPLYGVPDDLLVVDLVGLYPELKGLRLRGRLEGRRVVPYYSREEIERGDAALARNALLWVDDPIDLFFLQIQGSGRVRLDSGESVRVGFADQNGHPYRSIGRALIERGELTLDRASMQGIKAWAKQNPDKLTEILNHNASFVFFRELPAGLPGPIGALAVPITAGRSIAIDARYIPLGAPLFLATTWPNTSRPLNRLMVAQDTGGAIRGGVRGDFFWGFGDEAGAQAGRMRQTGRMWVLLPLGVNPDQLLGR